jgi:hypothetical protein
MEYNRLRAEIAPLPGWRKGNSRESTFWLVLGKIRSYTGGWETRDTERCRECGIVWLTYPTIATNSA